MIDLPKPRTLEDALEQVHYLKSLVTDIYSIDPHTVFASRVGVRGDQAALLRVLYERFPEYTETSRMRSFLADRRVLLEREDDLSNENAVLSTQMGALRRALATCGAPANALPIAKPGRETFGFRLSNEGHAWIAARLACPPSM